MCRGMILKSPERGMVGTFLEIKEKRREKEIASQQSVEEKRKLTEKNRAWRI